MLSEFIVTAVFHLTGQRIFIRLRGQRIGHRRDQTEVSHFDFTVCGEKYIARLQISMDQSSEMHVFDGIDDLLEHMQKLQFDISI